MFSKYGESCNLVIGQLELLSERRPRYGTSEQA